MANRTSVLLQTAGRALRRARGHALAVATAIAVSGGIALPVLAIHHVERLTSPGPDPVGLLLAGGWPAGWGTSLETPAQHAGVLASRDLLVCFAALAITMACATIAALVLSRAAARRREVAVRAAVGASPADVLRDVGFEAALLGGLSAAALGALALIAGVALSGSRPELLRSWIAFRPGVLALGVGLGAPLLALLLFAPLAALPAASSRLARALGMAHATPPPFEGSLRRALAVAQLAAALSLLIGAGLLLRGGGGGGGTGVRAGRGVPGAGARLAPRSSVFTIAPGRLDMSPERRAAFYDSVLERVRRVRGVTAASMAAPGAWVGQGAEDMLMLTCPRCRIDGIGTPIMGTMAQHQLVGPGFFAALGLAPVRGRELGPLDGDGVHTAPVAVIDRGFEALFQGTVDPIGQWIRIGSDGVWYRIVGIVPNLRPPGVGAALGSQATAYLPLPRHPPRAAELVVRFVSDGGDDAAVRAAVAAAGGRAGGGIRLQDALARLAAPLHWFGAATLALAAVVLFLALHGVAVVAIDDVRRRRRELAIRSALGAPPWRIVAAVLGRGIVRVVAGAAWASGGAIIVAWLLGRVSPALPLFDLSIYAGALALIAAVSLLASLFAVAAALRVQAREALAEE